MGWGRLKPFWKSKAWEESKENRTGFFSWGDSDYANFFDPTGTLDKALDNITSADAPKTPSASEIANAVPPAYAGYGNKEVIYLIAILVAYKVLFK